MNAIGPGDWVECIGYAEEDDPSTWIADDDYPQVGSIYRVDAITEHDGLILAEFAQIDLEWDARVEWDAEYFRPVYRPKAEIIEALRQPSPELEPA